MRDLTSDRRPVALLLLCIVMTTLPAPGYAGQVVGSSGCFDRPGLSCEVVEIPAMQGTVKWFSDTKGYGFIVPSDGSPDLFVHYSDIEGSGRRSLREGDQVEFEVAEGQKGPKATNVRAAEQPAV